jgi:predicted metal-dependent phosphotriesterase family hydrolase
VERCRPRGDRHASAHCGSRSKRTRATRCIETRLHAQLFLSNDWVFGDTERDKINPDGLLYTTRKTIPYLKHIGVTEPEIRIITVENPRRFFGGT